MNPRQFCREYTFARALALTYSFHPLFFERIVLRDLGYGGSTDITVVGDQHELQNAVTRYAGQFNYLGKSYLLAPAETSGTFHPKLLLRVGVKGARLLLGSGNLTFGGWGGNRELAYQLRLEAHQPGSAAAVHHILESVSPYLTSEVGRNALDRLRDYPWLATTEEGTSTILMTKPMESLSTQLQRRWAGRRFNRMLALTGSTDERGAFISWCHDEFGIEECVVAVSPENASFVKSKIDQCPAKVSLAPFSGSQMLHAKFYWFDGPDGSAAIVGSANCSGAAWLRSPVQGNGNIELIQVYDNANEDDFVNILSSIPEIRIGIERTTSAEIIKRMAPSYWVKAIYLYRGQGHLEVFLNQALSADATTVFLGPEGVNIHLDVGDNGLLTGLIPETIAWPETTGLAKVRVILGEMTYETPLHWINDMDAIIRASQIKPPAEPFKNLPKSGTTSEHEKVISDLAMISASIFSESAAYRDPPKRKVQDRRTNDQPAAEPVKPEDLVKSLNDLDASKGDMAKESGTGIHLSMNGIMRALFEEVETTKPSEDEGSTANPEDPENGPSGEGSKSRFTRNPLPKERELPTTRHQQRLKDDLDRFFDKFSAPEFSIDCTATKLVQAAAYPLAIALLGERGGWLDAEEARAIVTRVVDILLNRQRAEGEDVGLLAEVRKRYLTNGQDEIFLQVVGDGTLWVALLAVLARLSWEQDNDKFERAINIYRVYSCEIMRTDTSIGKLTSLVTRLDVERARELIASEAPRLAIAVDTIEQILKNSRETLLKEQSSKNHLIGDHIWNPVAGWGVVAGMGSASTMEAYLHLRGETRKVARKNYYVNLRMAAESSAELKRNLDIILES